MNAHDHSPAHFTVKTYSLVFAALLVLLAITVAIAEVDFGAMNVFAAMFIATIKATLVVLYFMQVKRSIPMIKVYAAVASLWLVIGVILVFCDYLTRRPVL